MSKKKKISNLLQMEKVKIIQFFVLDGHGYLQNEGVGACGHEGLRSHDYSIAISSHLKDTVALGYNASSSP